NATVMMLTSATQKSDAERCQKLGVVAHVTKPVRQSDLFDAIMISVGSPRRFARTQRPVERTGTPAIVRPLRILLAEDNRVNQQLAVAVLTKRGYQVYVAENGRIALE